jgi:hypothetical protein
MTISSSNHPASRIISATGLAASLQSRSIRAAG